MPFLAINVTQGRRCDKGSSCACGEIGSRGKVFRYKSSNLVSEILLSFDARRCQRCLPGKGATKYPNIRVDDSQGRVSIKLVLGNLGSVILSATAIFVDAPLGFLSEVRVSPSGDIILHVRKIIEGGIYACMLSNKLLLNLDIEQGALTSVHCIFRSKSLLQIRHKL